MNVDLDLILYAVIAVVILTRLWSVLGTRNDGDIERPNPFAVPADDKKSGQTQDAAFAANPRPGDRPNDRPGNRPVLLKTFQAAPASLAGGLEQVKQLDPAFDEKQFLQGARAAFTMIIEDFAQGDMARSERFLAPAVLAHFRAALEARRQAGQTLENKIDGIAEAEIIAARTDGKQAYLTVRFVSRQQTTLRDAAGQTIGGSGNSSGDKLDEVTDIWTFVRDTASIDPNWQLASTGD
jgi:predicted lipid-binding transport protein (Tim44 family)